MTTLKANLIQNHRSNILKAVEGCIIEELESLKKRASGFRLNLTDFYYYAEFFSPPVFDLFAWEQITRMEIRSMPEVREYFRLAYLAADNTQLNGFEDPEFNLGRGRRNFQQIASAELAINVLPRLRNLMDCWGIAVNKVDDELC